MTPSDRATSRFSSKLFRYPGKGGWTFAPVPKKRAPPVTHGWGRTPVHANVDGYSWATSVWRTKDGTTLLPVPRAARGAKGHGSTVRVELTWDVDDEVAGRPSTVVGATLSLSKGRRSKVGGRKA